jgi:hypothetical protein
VADDLEIRAALEALSADARVLRLAELCALGLPAIRAYFRDPSRARYVDSVVGMQHEVDVELPERVLAQIRSARGIPAPEVVEALGNEYLEPLAAHQDSDLEFEDGAAELAYLAIYNLLQCCRKPDDPDRAWLVVVQVRNGLDLDLAHWWRSTRSG